MNQGSVVAFLISMHPSGARIFSRNKMKQGSVKILVN